METDGGGWTVFQRRQDGSENFYRGWQDYEDGFGDLTGEFWLGLKNLNRLTQIGTDNTLRVDLQDFENNQRHSQFAIFNVDSAATNYLLTVDGFIGGSAGNSMTLLTSNTHNGQQFTTWDRDNDHATGTANCAQIFEGAWWYHSCHTSNLNGRYLSGPHTTYANGVNWGTWRGYYYSLKVTEMKVRSYQ